MTIKTPDINAISGVITDELLTEYDEIQAVTQKEASISSISNTYQLLNKGISGKELDYVNLAHPLLEDEAGLNNVPMGVSNQSLEVLEAESADLSLSRKDDTNLAPGNKWHPCTNMGPPSLEGQGYDQHRGSYYFINQSNQSLAKKSQMQRHKRLGISIVQRLEGTFRSWHEKLMVTR